MDVNDSCFFCGRKRHPRNECPAKELKCNACDKKRTLGKMCRKKTRGTDIVQEKSKNMLQTRTIKCRHSSQFESGSQSTPKVNIQFTSSI